MLPKDDTNLNEREAAKRKVSERDAYIFELYQKGETLQEIGNQFELSRERVRQIVNATIKRIVRNEAISKGIIIDAAIFSDDISRKRQQIKESQKIVKPKPIPKERRWSMYYAACRSCGTTSVPHVRKGLCEECAGIFTEKRREEIITRHNNQCDVCKRARIDAKIAFGRDLYITKQKKVLCQDCYKKMTGKILGDHKLYEWSRLYPKCKSCGTTTVPHLKRGLCENCSDFYSERQREALIQEHGSKCDRCGINREQARKEQGRDFYATKNKLVYCRKCFQTTAKSRFHKK